MSAPTGSRSSPTPAATLERVVGLSGAVALGLGSILGTGVFVSLGIATGVIGSGVALALVLAALVALMNGLSSAQLAAAYPVSGGTYAYAHALIHPTAGFAAGWMFLLAKSASAATAALGCAGYALRMLGLADTHGLRVGLALALVLAFTALVARGMRRSQQANLVMVALTLAALATFVAFGAVSADAADVLERIGPATWRAFLGTPTALLHATALLFVAYTGYGRIATLGEEVRAPEHTIPRAVVTTLVASMLVYVAVATTALAVVGPGTFAAFAAEGAAPLEQVARRFESPEVAWVVSLGAVSAMAGVLTNLLLGLSRVLLAMARRGDMPSALSVLSASTHSPRRAVWAVGAGIAALVLLGDLRLTWSFSAFSVLVYYGLTNLAALRLPTASRRYPRAVALLGLMSCSGLAFFVDRYVWITGLGVLGIGLAGRALARRIRA